MSKPQQISKRADEILGKKRPRQQGKSAENMSDSERRKYQNQDEM